MRDKIRRRAIRGSIVDIRIAREIEPQSISRRTEVIDEIRGTMIEGTKEENVKSDSVIELARVRKPRVNVTRS